MGIETILVVLGASAFVAFVLGAGDGRHGHGRPADHDEYRGI
ncbi:MAG TPA: hypothetical protein VFJ90_16295 [Candidatus Didemnitutus sp.]|nr:hypothetical protein [Candidatus Didemnitutus sp.]